MQDTTHCLEAMAIVLQMLACPISILILSPESIDDTDIFYCYRYFLAPSSATMANYRIVSIISGIRR